jgi:hypothetical protein
MMEKFCRRYTDEKNEEKAKEVCAVAKELRDAQPAK